MRLKVKGDIIPNDHKFMYDWIGWESCCPSDAEKAIADALDGEPLEVEISSGGGYIFAGSEIYSAIRGYSKGEVKIEVTGLAASAASVIAMAGHCEMSPTALMMIHNVSGSAHGDYRAMEQEAEALREANQAMMTAYVEKTGIDRDTLGRLMDDETWISANRAVELGFADGIIQPKNGVRPTYTNSIHTIPEDVLSALRGMIKKNDPEAVARARHELEYLNLQRKDF